MSQKQINKQAECVRRVGNWSKIEAKHRFDKSSFRKKDMVEDIELASPKMEALFHAIQELDKRDMENEGKLYKHMIYSDVKALGYGAKIIAAAFIARGYNPAYKGDFNVSQAALAKNSYTSFALLCSTPVYDKPITVKLKNAILQTYNSRPDNIYGKNIRFLILDQGYKEGIDVFDIKYIHLFEPTITAADEKQAIGRGTRMCGQRGLNFHQEKGWPLQVYRYNSKLPQDEMFKNRRTIHELFLDLSGYDVRAIQLANQLERMCILGAVDYELTKSVHTFSLTGKGSLYSIPAEIIIELGKEPRTLKNPRNKDKITLYGKEYQKGQPIRCHERCKGVIQIPTNLMLIAWVVASNDRTPFYDNKPRWFLCREMALNHNYCRILNLAWKNPANFIQDRKTVIYNSLNSILRAKERYVVKSHVYDMANLLPYDMRQALDISVEEPSAYVPGHVPPPQKLSFLEMREHILREFADCKWPEVSIENRCEQQQGGTSIVNFTPTQEFIMDYFKPTNPYKGMLLYQSVGTGKTCTAIATATNSFEKENYTILWVTRHTLKSDIWKNMFNQVCSIVFQEKLQEGLNMPKELKDQKKLLPPNWVEPISYKQFSNFLSGRNKKLEKIITDRNGHDDPLHKTLIIIDEAHKLYAPDVPAAERPNVDVLRKMIHTSYKKSGPDSARVLLMSATPYTADPMELIKLLNILREEDDQFPETFEDFKRAFLDDTGRFTTKGAAYFIRAINGYISYLNREKDVRQFAYPILKEINVSISQTPQSNEKLENELSAYEKMLEMYQGVINEQVPQDIIYYRNNYKEETKICKDLPTKKERDECKARITKEYKAEREKLEKELTNAKKGRDKIKTDITKTKNTMKLMEKEDISQETALRRDCFKDKK
jgi:hypothetical protein